MVINNRHHDDIFFIKILCVCRKNSRGMRKLDKKYLLYEYGLGIICTIIIFIPSAIAGWVLLISALTENVPADACGYYQQCYYELINSNNTCVIDYIHRYNLNSCSYPIDGDFTAEDCRRISDQCLRPQNNGNGCPTGECSYESYKFGVGLALSVGSTSGILILAIVFALWCYQEVKTGSIWKEEYEDSEE